MFVDTRHMRTNSIGHKCWIWSEASQGTNVIYDHESDFRMKDFKQRESFLMATEEL